MSGTTLETEGDMHVAVTRRVAGSPEAVYSAHAEPRLIQKWLLGLDGWTMPVCVSEARPGGKIGYEWTDGKGAGFHLTGEYLELGLSAGSSTWSGCTCPTLRRTTMSKRCSTQTGPERW
jgi:hypothetical protein